MSHFHSHADSHAHLAPVQTTGKVINWAWLYNVYASRILKKSNPTILKLAGVKPGATLLDVGCGPGSLTIAAKAITGVTGEVYGVDASVPMIQQARRQASKANLKVNFEVGLAESLPFEDGKFEVVVSRLAFHHLPGDLKERATAEIYRVLKPGGTLLIVDFDPHTLPRFSILRLHRTITREMMKVDINEYMPLLEANHFTEIKSGPTGYDMLSYIKGLKAV